MGGKNKKYWARLLTDQMAAMGEYPHWLDFRSMDINDEGIDWVVMKIKGVGMLDLNETEITNESIAYLVKLEYVKELRMKGCDIDDNCVVGLDRIKGLEFLHVAGTGITIDGLLQILDMGSLKTLLFSGEKNSEFAEKMLALRNKLPGCSFVVNSVPYSFEDEYLSK